jgi:RNA polymerase sigma-70 factor (ECF subfamily)
MLDLHPEPLSPEAPAGRSTDQGPTKLPDLLLIERARTRDAGAWEAIMQRYNQRLFRIARSILPTAEAAADLVAESYLHAFADLEHCDPDSKLGAWLARIAFTQALKYRRDGAARATLARVENGSAAPDQALERAIDGLPEVFRTVFVLRAVEEISGTETAACLGVNETTVRTRLYRAHRRLPAEVDARVKSERNSIFGLSDAHSAWIISRVFARLGS